MKAVQFSQFGGPDVLQVREVADPIAAQNEVLIEVKATTVNRLDLFQRNGSRPVGNLPFTPGLEAAGVVLQDSNGFRAGERVLTTRASQARGGGGYASKLAVPATDLARIPEGVSFEQAVAAGLAASTAWGSLFDLGHLQAGERVLIWAGSSGVGSIAIQLAKHAGAWVASTASSEERIKTLKQLGADEAINHRQQSVSKILQSSGGVQLVIELVSSSLQDSIDSAAPEGRIILIGNLGGKEATVDTQSWRLKRVSVIGGGQLHTSVANEEKILRLIAEKAVQPLIARVLPIEQAAEAHRLLESGDVQGKIVLTFA
ncbi:quinone oxidoreductase family protein [Dictyobacter kobayashii]|uniref:NAD(P)H quinone oxidoreductase n=1 Tax=Dictyobacter kobayashii TaxID=2014872 RepID=A0A402AEC4_9CHLR|nr:zinc-binding dehydrogenase [Dictyobacter kobayashii]GCE17460.1 NAD(P)H quinone oxidoreductase [Dictyobacter kobayashii]